MLSRLQCNVLRGIAILGIMLHNYTHWLGPMVKENEYTYNQHNVERLIVEMANPSLDIIAHLLSFFGHYGVPIFVFLSAYGLVMKYEKGAGTAAEESAWQFVWSHYKKLFMMMVVGYTAFVLVDYMTPGPRHYEFWNVVGQLGMFSNLYSDPDHVIWPGPYWYFGLMVQVYLVYRFVLYRGKYSLGGLLPEKLYTPIIIALAIGTLLAQGFMDPMGNKLEWYRYNVMGSLPVFIFGLCYARRKTTKPAPRWFWLVMCIVMTACIVAGSMTFATWMLVPFAVCLSAIALVKLLPHSIMQPMAWVGGISSAIFVCHPITRKVIIPISRHGDLYAGLLLYLVATLVLAVIFQHLMTIVNKKT